VAVSSLWFGFYAFVCLFAVLVSTDNKSAGQWVRFCVLCVVCADFSLCVSCVCVCCYWMLISALALFILQSRCHTIPPSPSYLSCVQWNMHVSIMALKSQNPPSTKKRHPHRWTIDVGPGVFYICSANGNLYTSKWKAQKALQKCFPNAFFHFFLLYFIQLCSKE